MKRKGIRIIIYEHMYEKVSAFRDGGKGICISFATLYVSDENKICKNSIMDLDRRPVIEPESEEPPCRYQFLSKQL
jgi:hypothetical protein